MGDNFVGDVIEIWGESGRGEDEGGGTEGGERRGMEGQQLLRSSKKWNEAVKVRNG